MSLPFLNGSQSRTDVQGAFYGINRNIQINDGEFYDMQNMCGDSYPVISTRPFRGKEVTAPGEIWGAAGYNDKIISVIKTVSQVGGETVTEGTIYLDTEERTAFDGFTLPSLSDNKRNLITAGAYLIILPDKKYINLTNPTDFGDLEAVKEIIDVHPEPPTHIFPVPDFKYGTYTSFTLCDSEGAELKPDLIGAEEPQTGDYYTLIGGMDREWFLRDLEVMLYFFSGIADEIKDISSFMTYTESSIPSELKSARDSFINSFDNIFQKFTDGYFNYVVAEREDLLSKLSVFHTLAFTDTSRIIDTEEFQSWFDYLYDRIPFYFGAYSTTEPYNGALEKREITLTDGFLWYNEAENELQRYYFDNALWLPVTTYIKVSHENIGAGFKSGDFVKISGLQESYTLSSAQYDQLVMALNLSAMNLQKWLGNAEPITELTITDSNIASLNTPTGEVRKIETASDGYLIFKGTLKYSRYLYLDPVSEEYVTLKREIPATDFMFECGNRLWGCHYGDDGNGNFINEIFCSMQGDFTNWNSFDGIATDSYRASVGSQGAFTGAVNFNGYPTFFKENVMHRVYGSLPESYQISTANCDGVQVGSSESMKMLGGILFYLSKSGIMAYDGSLPVKISENLGLDYLSEGTALTDKGKYYLSARVSKRVENCDGFHFNPDTGEWESGTIRESIELFVYDTAKKLWYKEEPERFIYTANTENGAYFVTNRNANAFQKIRDNVPSADEDDFHWFVETGDITVSLPNRKYVKRLIIRGRFSHRNGDSRTCTKVFIKYDNDIKWRLLNCVNQHGLNSDAVIIRPVRCDHFKIRLCGTGKAEIHSITKIIENGSDIDARKL